MDPVTLTGISIAASAAGAGVSAIGSSQAGKAGQASYGYKAAVAGMNTKIAKQNADYARSVGEVEAQQSGMKTRYQIGKTRAIQGASGLDVNKGSAVRVRESIADIGSQDADMIRNNAARKAYGYEVEAANATAQGAVYNMAGSQAKKAGNIGAFTSILSGASSVAGKWSQAQSSGVFGGSGGDGSSIRLGNELNWNEFA